MTIIAGLGNPGRKYARTRHNVGFMVIDALSGEWGIALEKKQEYCLGRGVVDGRDIVLLKPLTFMNRSGAAVLGVMRRAGREREGTGEALIVVHDDLDMDVGRVKIKRSGSSGGHRGIESIIQSLGTKDFARVKIGIGRTVDVPAHEFVLSKFSPSEQDLVKDAIIKAAHAVTAIIIRGLDGAMNEFNKPLKRHREPQGEDDDRHQD
ncbi:MAG TPA: aminoacyl-tRNA hydrolase [Dissulfurispiraceae bacterium]|nr:aminoacyl-tRNA hydrolase [Dissulfurispiraceae bacterium]